MKHAHPSFASSLVAVGSAVVAIGGSFTVFADAAQAQAAGDRTAMVGGALPGGAIISARSVAVAPAAGGVITAAPVGPDGSFRVTGLEPGPYRLALTSTSVPKQTQGATFGEKVNQGLHAAGSAIQQGASLSRREQTSGANAKGGINGINGGMPNRISMNVTTPKQTRQMVVDETVMDVEVGADGVLQGRVSPP